ncbi:NTP transferase domain-containing protein [Candidatus Woesearchaeota archaeon]|nr:NTP transferase domain-containing protein [Candidatus Woesearchaeota archaeon]
MKAVMMVAGKSTRTHPLTVTRPKPLLKVLNKTIIEHNLDQLSGIVNEVVIIVGYRKDMIIEHLGSSYKGMRLTYIEQKEQLGTGHALQIAEKHAGKRFIVMYGDDIYSGKDIMLISKVDNSVLAKKVENPENFGVFVTEGDRLVRVIEKPKEFVSDLANVGCFMLTDDIFPYLKKVKKSVRGEYEITDALSMLAEEQKVTVVPAKDYWFPIGYPWNLLEANAYLLKSIKQDIKGEVEDNVTIKGNVIIGKGTVVRSGTYIEGPVIIGEDCQIGPSAYIRPDTAIGDRCKFRGEAFDMIMMDDSVAKHNCYIGHSVLGVDVNIGAGTITSDYRHDGKSNMTIVNGKKIDSGRRKLGSFMGDHVRTGINTSIYPGRKLWPNTGTLPGSVVKKDITEVGF